MVEHDDLITIHYYCQKRGRGDDGSGDSGECGCGGGGNVDGFVLSIWRKLCSTFPLRES